MTRSSIYFADNLKTKRDISPLSPSFPILADTGQKASPARNNKRWGFNQQQKQAKFLLKVSQEIHCYNAHYFSPLFWSLAQRSQAALLGGLNRGLVYGWINSYHKKMKSWIQQKWKTIRYDDPIKQAMIAIAHKMQCIKGLTIFDQICTLNLCWQPIDWHIYVASATLV